jgi:ABC-type bacteriocin/lantibiotic exporter with double-glycine peptidase domain
MPRGLDTAIGNGSSSLSGGQKQRIAVARSRLRGTPVLILDESTSVLNYVSRKAIMDAIREWRREKITIIITHDISQIREEDLSTSSRMDESLGMDIDMHYHRWRKEAESARKSSHFSVCAF